MNWNFLVCFAVIHSSLIANAKADFVYDGFDYAPGGQLLQQSGGVGFNGDWYATGFGINRTNFGVNPSSLDNTNLAVSGGSVSAPSGNINGIGRNLPTSLLENGTHYLSFVIRRNNTLGDFGGFGGLYLDGSNDDIFVGKPGTNDLWSIESRGGAGQVRSNFTAQVNQSTLLVLKIATSNIVNNAESFTLFVNPIAGASEPTASAFKRSVDLGTISSLVLYNSGDFTFDEIRIGDTFEAVTPAITAVPESSSWILAAAGLGVIVLIQRGRTKVPGIFDQPS